MRDRVIWSVLDMDLDSVADILIHSAALQWSRYRGKTVTLVINRWSKMKIFKIIFAAHMGVVAFFLLLMIFGPLAFGFERMDELIGNYGVAIYFLALVIFIPIFGKYLNK